MSVGASSEGTKLIEEWRAAKRATERARSELANRQHLENICAGAVGKWLMPPDASIGEKIGVWFGDINLINEILVCATKCVDGYFICERAREITPIKVETPK